jgi:hypothetical protein
MAKIRPQRLVIDTDVSGAAGSKAGVSLSCARFLEAVRETGHRTVVTDVLPEEWKNHRSTFAAQWLRTMYAARKVDPISVEPDQNLRSAMLLNASAKDAETMQKDLHLLEAALATERRIVSKEVACRGCFRVAAARVARLRNVCWVDPTIPAEESIEWLHRGAPLDRHRLLGAGTLDR